MFKFRYLYYISSSGIKLTGMTVLIATIERDNVIDFIIERVPQRVIVFIVEKLKILLSRAPPHVTMGKSDSKRYRLGYR